MTEQWKAGDRAEWLDYGAKTWQPVIVTSVFDDVDGPRCSIRFDDPGQPEWSVRQMWLRRPLVAWHPGDRALWHPSAQTAAMYLLADLVPVTVLSAHPQAGIEAREDGWPYRIWHVTAKNLSRPDPVPPPSWTPVVPIQPGQTVTAGDQRYVADRPISVGDYVRWSRKGKDLWLEGEVTPAQCEAASTLWSARLRARTAESEGRSRMTVMTQMDPEDL